MNIERRAQPHPFEAISFSSGGVHAFAQLGVLASLIEAGVTEHVADWYGCSGGCIAAVCGILGGSPAWLREGTRIFDLRKATAIQDDLVLNLDGALGFVDPAKLLEILGRMAGTWAPGFPAWNFRDLKTAYPTASLHIIATNWTTGDIATFDADKTPDVRVLDAIRASIAVPPYFTPWQNPATGEIFTDGAVLESFPWSSIPSWKKRETLVVSCSEINQRDKSAHPATFMEFLGRIVHLAHKRTPASFTPASDHLIIINAKTVESMDFKVTQEQRLALFEEGGVAASKFLTETVSEIAGSHLLSSDPCTPAVPTMNPGRTEDSPGYHSPLRIPGQSRDSQTVRRLNDRRWSL
jgi:predicted acylesterase/phospholipase RssA